MKRLFLILGFWMALVACLWNAPPLDIQASPQSMFFGQNLSPPSVGGIALVNSTLATPGQNGGTTAAMNCTGANFVAVAVSRNVGVGSTVTSSPANTWVMRTNVNGAYQGSEIWDASNATVSSAMTVSVTDTAGYPAIIGACFSGLTSTPFDGQTTGAIDAGNSPLSTGSITPPSDGSLVLSAASVAFGGAGSGGVFSISSGYTVIAQTPEVGGTNFAGALAYGIQATSGATNPAWSWTSANPGAGTSVTIAAYK
jgi:hypothetical protein